LFLRQDKFPSNDRHFRAFSARVGASRSADYCNAGVSDSNGKQTLELTPDFNFLSDPAVVYPITVDPAPTLTATADTWVQSDTASSQNGSTELRSGTFNGGATVARSFIKFDLSQTSGKKILASTLRLRQFHQYSCTPRQSNVYALSAAFSSSTTWANQPSAIPTLYASASGAFGYSGCPEGDLAFDLTTLTDRWSSGAITNNGLQIRAASETDNLGWKKFRSVESGVSTAPRLVVNYTSFIQKPFSLVPANGNQVDTLTPDLSAIFADDKTRSIRSFFYLTDDVGNFVSNGADAGVVASGTRNTYSVPLGKLQDGRRYFWWAKGCINTDCSDESGHIFFDVQLAPGVPPLPVPTVTPPPTPSPTASSTPSPTASATVSPSQPPSSSPSPTGGTDVLWGVDSVNRAQDVLADTRSTYGNPEYFGRYIGNGPATALTAEEVEFLHGEGIEILIIDADLGTRTDGSNQTTDGTLTGQENGARAGQEAVRNANALGVPSGKAIFADIEAGATVDTAWLTGYFDAVKTGNFEPAFYANVRPANSFLDAYCAMAQNDSRVAILWSSTPSTGRTSKSDAPAYDPDRPSDYTQGCRANVYAWQYGLAGGGGGVNVDTDEVQSAIVPFLW
jgi:Domain of unknown function (DUF1906)